MARRRKGGTFYWAGAGRPPRARRGRRRGGGRPGMRSPATASAPAPGSRGCSAWLDVVHNGW